MRAAVSVKVLETGKRLLERGSFSFEKYALIIKGGLHGGGHSTLHT